MKQREIVISIVTVAPTTLVEVAESTPQPIETATPIPLPSPTDTAVATRLLQRPPGTPVAVEANTVALSAEWESFSSSNQAQAFAWAADGKLWQTGDGGVMVWDTNTGTSQQFTRDDGVPSNSGRAVAHAANGDVWLGTQDTGLGYWDGAEWRQITRRNGLTNNNVRALLIDQQQTLWVATQFGLMTQAGGAWQQHFLTSVAGQAENEFWSIFEAADGSVWLGSAAEIAMWNGTEWRQYTSGDGVVGGRVVAITQDATGRLWAAATRTILRLDGDVWQTMLTLPEGTTVNTIYATQTGRVWVGLSGDATQGAESDARYFEANAWVTPASLPFRSVLSFTESADGTLYLGTSAHGTWRFDGNNWTLLSDAATLKGSAIYDIALSADGQHVVSTHSGEVGRLTQNGSDATALPILQALLPPDGFINSSHRRPVVLDNDNNIWLGSVQSGIYRFNGQSWINYGVEEGVYDAYVPTLAVAPDGAVWAGSSFGLFKFADESWEQVWADQMLRSAVFHSQSGLLDQIDLPGPADLAILPNGDVLGYGSNWVEVRNGLVSAKPFTNGNLRAMRECACSNLTLDSAGVAWFGNAQAMARYAEQGLTPLMMADLGLPQTVMRSLDAGPHETLWIGTAGHGVYVWRQGEILLHFSAEDGLASNTVHETVFAENGDAWFATQGGVSHLAAAADLIVPSADATRPASTVQWELFTPSNENTDFSMADDQTLWAATNGGAVRWDLSTGESVKFTTQDGLPTNQLTSIVACQAPEPVVMAGGLAGLGIFDSATQRWDPILPTDGGTWTSTRDLICDETTQQIYINTGIEWLRWSADSEVSSVRFDPNLSNFSGGFDHIALSPNDGSVWFATTNELFQYRDGKIELVEAAPAWIERSHISDLEIAPDGSVWVLVNRQFGRRSADGTWQVYDHTNVPNFPDAWFRDMVFDADGQLWLSSGDLTVFDPETETAILVVENFRRSETLPLGAGVLAFENGHLFIDSGYSERGFTVHAGDTWQQFVRDELLQDEPTVRDIVQSADGTIWFGANGGLFEYSAEETWTFYDQPDRQIGSFASLLAAADDGIWTASFGLHFYDGETWETFDEDNGLPDRGIKGIALDPSGALWLSFDERLILWDEVVLQEWTRADGLPENNFVGKLLYHDNTLWFEANTRLGFVRDGQLSDFYYQTNRLNPGTLTPHPNGLYVVGDGLNISRFDADTDYLAPIIKFNGSPTDVAFDAAGNMWVSTRAGLYVVATTGGVKRYDAGDGLPSDELNTVFVDQSGRVWVGSEYGLAVYTP